jgi:hypothetical protein
MSIASQYNAAQDLLQALADAEDKSLVVRAIAYRKAEEAFQRIAALRSRITADHAVSERRDLIAAE